MTYPTCTHAAARAHALTVWGTFEKRLTSRISCTALVRMDERGRRERATVQSTTQLGGVVFPTSVIFVASMSQFMKQRAFDSNQRFG